MKFFTPLLLIITLTEAAPAPTPKSSQYEARAAGSMPCYIGCWTPCERIQCLNGGYCIQPAVATNLAYCNCPSHYTGYRCEQSVDPCQNYQCHHGTCQKDRNSQPLCSCYEGYGGSRCENQIDPCSKAKCNYGRCKIERSIVVCQCYQGYTGRDCLTPIDACARVSCNYGTCVNEGASYRCVCHQGYEGSACDRPLDLCANYVCYNGGSCHIQESQPMCQCTHGYIGLNCYEVEVVDPCLRYDCYGGTCMNDRGAARCICPIGRVGSRCQEDICTMYPCANNGQCIPESSTRRCICPSPYHGDDCREYTPPDPCENVYCGYGKCHNGICECYGGYTGVQCDVPQNLCANINCNYGTCNEGHCICEEDYTGVYCDILISTTSTSTISLTVTVTTTLCPILTPTVAFPGPKTGQLFDYGHPPRIRAGPIGWILGLIVGLLLLGAAIAYAVRYCAKPPLLTPRSPTPPGKNGVIQGAKTETDGLLAGHHEVETTLIEETREIIREYGVMDNATGIFTSFPTMSSRYGDFARDNQQQQTSTGYIQQRIIETESHPPLVPDFSVIIDDTIDGHRDIFETWESSCGGACGFSMNAMVGDGCCQTDYELSNINSISMTPNGKYAIVGQSQGPPQIWDAVNGQLVSSMQGTCSDCVKIELACNGTLLVGLAGDCIDNQLHVLQIWDTNTGKPVQLTHQVKLATFTLSNDTNILIMAGNQRNGRGISVGLLDLSNSELIKEIKSDTNQSYGGRPSFIALTPDERYAIVGCQAGATSTNYVVFDLTTPHDLIQPPTITFDTDPKCTLVLNKEQILTGTRNGHVTVWDVVACQRIQTLHDNGQSAHRDRITDLKLSPDRSYFVTASADGTVKVWDSNSKELITRLIGHTREITCVCVSTNQLVATGSRDQTICLWRVQTGEVASKMCVNMTPLDIHMAAHNRTVVAIGDKDNERQLLMLRVLSSQR